MISPGIRRGGGLGRKGKDEGERENLAFMHDVKEIDGLLILLYLGIHS